MTFKYFIIRLYNLYYGNHNFKINICLIIFDIYYLFLILFHLKRKCIFNIFPLFLMYHYIYIYIYILHSCMYLSTILHLLKSPRCKLHLCEIVKPLVFIFHVYIILFNFHTKKVICSVHYFSTPQFFQSFEDL